MADRDYSFSALFHAMPDFVAKLLHSFRSKQRASVSDIKAQEIEVKPGWHGKGALVEFPSAKTRTLIRKDYLSKWDGVPLSSRSSYMETKGDDIVIASTSPRFSLAKDSEEDKSCIEQAFKYTKIMIPHVLLVSVLIGYLCFGAWILMICESKTELRKRSSKLVRLSNLMAKQTDDSYSLLLRMAGPKVDPNFIGTRWNSTFRQYMVNVASVVDEYGIRGGNKIAEELRTPLDLSKIYNKWTFPTALLYVLTVLTACGYEEVSVNTDVGKIFIIGLALIGIPLTFITAADIGKFLSDMLRRSMSYCKRVAREIEALRNERNVRKKSPPAVFIDSGMDELFPVEAKDHTLWFTISAYVCCICLYCSMGVPMFIHWERTWSFIHTFHYGFNLVVTVGLGGIVVKDYTFLACIVAFVIVGLSVVTMCIDLASSHLKAYFERIHYFGRLNPFGDMSKDLKDMLSLLAALQRQNGGRLTWEDLRQFLKHELCDRPFKPHKLLTMLKFIDEASANTSARRQNSLQMEFTDDVPCKEETRSCLGEN